MSPTKSVLVCGSGVFGSSAAVAFLEQDGYSVRVIDRAVEQPAVDAASTDLNKVLRAGDYIDFEMAQLSYDAILEWRKPEWEGCYHENGVLVVGSADQDTSWITACTDNLNRLSLTAKMLPTPESIRQHFIDQGLGEHVSDFENRTGYYNEFGGWAEAERAVRILHKKVKTLGGTIEGGKEVAELVIDGSDVKGVRLINGEIIEADLVVVATGSWTPSLFHLPSLGISSLLTASGQSVGKWRLSGKDREIHDRMPIIADFAEGSYTFPPTPGSEAEGGGIIKTAIHHLGYIAPDVDRNGTSVPRTVSTPGASSDHAIPKAMVANLRNAAGMYFPRLAEKDFVSTRLCWYCETPNADFLCAPHPNLSNLFFFTGGSGHAFKFTPILASLFRGCFDRTISPSLQARFSFDSRAGDLGADKRGGSNDGRKILHVDELCGPEDLKAPKAAVNGMTP